MSETIVEHLQRMIAHGDQVGVECTQINIGEGAARQLAIELAAMQRHPAMSPAEIFASMMDGTAKFMDRAIMVAGKDAPR